MASNMDIQRLSDSPYESTTHLVQGLGHNTDSQAKRRMLLSTKSLGKPIQSDPVYISLEGPSLSSSLNINIIDRC